MTFGVVIQFSLELRNGAKDEILRMRRSEDSGGGFLCEFAVKMSFLFGFGYFCMSIFFLFSFVVVILFWGFCVLVLAVVFSYLFWGVFCTSIERPSNVAALFRSSPKGRRQTIALVIDSLVCHTDECEKAFRVVGQRA